jgi:hypothetical protein
MCLHLPVCVVATYIPEFCIDDMTCFSSFLLYLYSIASRNLLFQKMERDDRVTKADRLPLVGNLPPPIPVHTSQVFLDPECHGSFTWVDLEYSTVTSS